MTRFSDDLLGADSRIFREKVENRLKRLSGATILALPQAFSSAQDIKRRFPDSHNHDLIIWGDRRLLHVHFPLSKRIKGSNDLSLLEREFGFKLVMQSPSIALSGIEEIGASNFLSDLMAGIYLSRSSPLDGDVRSELLLMGAARTESRWRSRAHRALPAWLVANQALLRGVGEDRFESGEMRCALRWYKYASGLFRVNDNPELAAAIYNNWGVAVALSGWHQGDQASVKTAVQLFKRAIKTRFFTKRSSAGEHTWKAARKNLWRLKGKAKQKRRAIKRKKRDGQGRQGMGAHPRATS